MRESTAGYVSKATRLTKKVGPKAHRFVRRVEVGPQAHLGRRVYSNQDIILLMIP